MALETGALALDGGPSWATQKPSEGASTRFEPAPELRLHSTSLGAPVGLRALNPLLA